MIFEINNILVSSDLLKSEFICDLSVCKGACCIQGDSGAPIQAQELEDLTKNYDKIKPFMQPEGLQAVEEKGLAYFDQDGDQLIQLAPSEACVFAVWDPDNSIRCAIEKAHSAGATDFQKPISCHLYPIRAQKIGAHLTLSYHKWNICKAACKLGKKHKMKVYQFLEKPLVRAFGQDFFDELQVVEKEMIHHNL
jgi:hypothetical protein